MKSQQDKHASRKTRATIGRFRDYGVKACTVIAIVGCLVGLLFFARPETSSAERRQLTAYPDFTVDSFLDGSFFDQFSLWYADTYPLREPMVTASQGMHKLFGITSGPAIVNANVQADEIPVDPAAGAQTGATESSPASGAVGSETSAEEMQSTAATPTPASSADKPEIDGEIPWGRTVDEAVQYSIMNGLYIKDGVAYSICYFSQTGADIYVAAANSIAEQLEGTANVYSILVPSSAIVLPQEEYDSVGGSDQRQVLDYVWARFDDGVTHVDLLDTMLANKDGYPYFRTDHHWTMRGAYLGYVEYCKARGIKPASLDSYEYRDMGEFAGSYYDTILMYGDADIDDFETFTPTATNDMVYRLDDWSEESTNIVKDSSDWDIYGKYDSLSGCDPSSGYIHNPKLHDGSSCLVVKDSYGSAFIPFLVANYEYVHMLDTRVYPGSVCDYVRDYDVQDVILVFGIKVGLDDYFATQLYNCTL